MHRKEKGTGPPFEWRGGVGVRVQQAAQLGVPVLRGGVEPSVEGVLGSEDDGLAVVQPRIFAASRGSDDSKRPEGLRLA